MKDELPEGELMKYVMEENISACNGFSKCWSGCVARGLEAIGVTNNGEPRDISGKVTGEVVWKALHDTDEKHLIEVREGCNGNEMLRTYLRWFSKDELSFTTDRLPSYLWMEHNNKLKKGLARFRTGCHELQVALGRMANVPRTEAVQVL